MPLAVLDLGSNSFHLSVYAATGSRVVAPRREEREPVRLGASLEGGRIDGAGFARGLAAVARLVRVLELEEPGCRVVAVATSAIREAGNGRAFADEVARRHGVAVEILGGEEEARATFAGARAFAGAPGRLAVVDLGGGSLEIATGAATTSTLGVESSGRDTIAIGAAVLHAMMQVLGFERAGISPFALREGIAARELRRRPGCGNRRPADLPGGGGKISPGLLSS